jgi:hypothetical protein
MTDPAIVGVAHVGYAKVGVKGPIFLDDLIRQLENQPVSSGGGSGAAETILIWDEGNWDECFWA